MKYKYIVIEWIHGAWKSFVAKKLFDYLFAKWINCKYYHFPDEDSLFGKTIREIITDSDLIEHREVVWLLYASFANQFHLKTKDDWIIYILDRHSVSTWLIFQKEIPDDIRKSIYKFGIDWLQKDGIVFYIKTQKEIALERLTKRSKDLINKEEKVRQDKANDKFYQKFDKLSDLYDNLLIDRLWYFDIKSHLIDNNNEIDDTIKEIYKHIV